MPLTVALTAQTRTAPTAMSRRLTPIPMLRSPFPLQGKRARALRRYGRARAPGAARLPLPADPGPSTRVRGGDCGVPRGPWTPDPDGRLGAAKLFRSVPRGALRGRQPGLWLVAGHEVPVVLRAGRPAERARAESPQRQVDPLLRPDEDARRSDLPHGADTDGARGGVGAAAAPPRGCRPVDPRRHPDGARSETKGAETAALSTGALRRPRQPQRPHRIAGRRPH